MPRTSTTNDQCIPCQVQSKGSCQFQNVYCNSETTVEWNLNAETAGDCKGVFLHWGDVLAYFCKSVTYLAGFFGGRCVEAGGGHGVDLQESPHGSQEPLMPQEQGCHLTLCVITDRHCMLIV